jgi:hypothetical protein
MRISRCEWNQAQHHLEYVLASPVVADHLNTAAGDFEIDAVNRCTAP